MTDIVERLRNRNNPENRWVMMTEAADAIERLTAEFKLILCTAPWSDKDGHSECLRIARRALEPPP